MLKPEKALEVGLYLPIILEMPGKRMRGFDLRFQKPTVKSNSSNLRSDSLTSAANSCLTHDGAAFSFIEPSSR